MVIKIAPEFESYTRLDDTPQIDMTTFIFKNNDGGTLVRVINFGESYSGSPASAHRVRLSKSEANVDLSTLSLTFDHFVEDEFVFDPGTLYQRP